MGLSWTCGIGRVHDFTSRDRLLFARFECRSANVLHRFLLLLLTFLPALEELATMRGRVIDPHGRPVAAARVEFRLHHGGPAWNWSMIGTRTDARGCFEYANLEAGSTTVIARAPGWASSREQAFVLRAGQVVEDLELQLRAGGRLSGEVFRDDGSPDCGREITIRSTASAERFGRTTLSDEQGFFELDALEPGRYLVAALPEDPGQGVERVKMSSVRIAGGETTHVVLGRRPVQPVRLHGRVLLASMMIEDLTVICLREGTGMASSMQAEPVSGDATYAVTLEAPGRYLILLAEADSGYPYAEFPVDVPAGEAFEHDLAVPLGTIRGRVLDANGSGLRGVPVVLASAGPPSFYDLLGGRQTTTDTGGRYAFHFLPAGSYSARAGLGFEGAWNPTGHAVAVSPGLDLEPNGKLDAVDLVLARPGRVVGSVRDTAGEAVPGATLFLRDESGQLLNPHSSFTTDTAGRFEFPHAAPGMVTVTARSESSCSQESTPTLVRAGEAAEVSLVLDSATHLSISVVDRDGRALRARVRILDALGRDVGAMRKTSDLEATFADGLVTSTQSFGPLAPGSYEVIATDTEGRTQRCRVRLDGHPQRRLEMRVAD